MEQDRYSLSSTQTHTSIHHSLAHTHTRKSPAASNAHIMRAGTISVFCARSRRAIINADVSAAPRPFQSHHSAGAARRAHPTTISHHRQRRALLRFSAARNGHVATKQTKSEGSSSSSSRAATRRRRRSCAIKHIAFCCQWLVCLCVCVYSP